MLIDEVLKEELTIIANNLSLIKKVYLIGLLNSKEIYGKKLQ